MLSEVSYNINVLYSSPFAKASRIKKICTWKIKQNAHGFVKKSAIKMITKLFKNVGQNETFWTKNSKIFQMQQYKIKTLKWHKSASVMHGKKIVFYSSV